jgi:hypothetical protein
MTGQATDVANDPLNATDPSGEDGILVSIDLDALFLPVGAKGEAGVYKEFDWRPATFSSLKDGFLDNPFNPSAALFDAYTDTKEIGTAETVSHGGGIDISAALSITYFRGSSDSLRGWSGSVEGGIPIGSIEVSSFLNEEQLTSEGYFNLAPDAVSVDVGPSLTTFTGTATMNHTFVQPWIVFDEEE